MYPYGGRCSRRSGCSPARHRSRDWPTYFLGAAEAAGAGAASAAGELSVLPDRLQLQVEQIADRLRAEQEQIDRREADLHAQLAEQENEARAARLWLRERRR